MKTLISIILFISTFNLKSQEKILVDYDKFCNHISAYEELMRINTRVSCYSLEYNLLTIELSSVINCGEADTGYFKFSNDTLFLFTEKVPKIIVNEGDTMLDLSVVECDCLFDISFDIYGFSTLPKASYLNGKQLEMQNVKYKRKEYKEIKDSNQIYFDDCGYEYRFLNKKNGEIDKIIRRRGFKKEIFKFDDSGKLSEIELVKMSIDNTRTIKLNQN